MAHISSKRNGAVKKNSLGVSQTKNNYYFQRSQDTLFCAASSKKPSDWAQDTLYVAARSSTDLIRISARDNLHHWWKDMKSGESCVKMCKYIGIAVDV